MPADADKGKQAVVLVSGGLDSATVLALAASAGARCHALTLDYGQRHRVELNAAQRVAQALHVVEHRVVRLDIGWMGGSALTDSTIPVPQTPTEGIPSTYVPARNTVFLSIALAWAEVLDAVDIYIGANAVDYSGYPDCRPEFIQAFETLANLATKAGVEGRGFRVHAPLMNLSKSEIIRLGTRLGVDYSLTVSCYDPDAAGRACGGCDACRLRTRGFADAEIDDPTRYVAGTGAEIH
jgi:7-cyano-7-deazaguanine synthase